MVNPFVDLISNILVSFLFFLTLEELKNVSADLFNFFLLPESRKQNNVLSPQILVDGPLEAFFKLINSMFCFEFGQKTSMPARLCLKR
ncbi:hypothetical protein L596_022062 [Steinernema carpocapsae]|uniref:Uncharacterized protein n=1 Tax=Steinernema carpocapsae TaxID=34508 RepID=A0A4U5MLG0_STECR|nr:hypothetical protein L596_022062 [Steinernema carpocapsae]